MISKTEEAHRSIHQDAESSHKPCPVKVIASGKRCSKEK